MINTASIGRGTTQGTAIVARATNWIFRPFRPAADGVFSAIRLVAAGDFWPSLKNEIFDSYRPELHYMRGAGPKWREKFAQAQDVAPPQPRCRIPTLSR